MRNLQTLENGEISFLETIRFNRLSIMNEWTSYATTKTSWSHKMEKRILWTKGPHTMWHKKEWPEFVHNVFHQKEPNKSSPLDRVNALNNHTANWFVAVVIPASSIEEKTFHLEDDARTAWAWMVFYKMKIQKISFIVVAWLSIKKEMGIRSAFHFSFWHWHRSADGRFKEFTSFQNLNKRQWQQKNGFDRIKT